jgi:thioredoxin 1
VGEVTRSGGNAKVSELILHTTDDGFDADVIQSDTPVLLDFWAEWCSPFKMIAPILDQIASEYEGRLRIVKLNIDENPQTPQKFNIRSIPTLLLFSKGSVAAQQVGAVGKAQLESFLGQHLGNA